MRSQRDSGTRTKAGVEGAAVASVRQCLEIASDPQPQDTRKFPSYSESISKPVNFFGETKQDACSSRVISAVFS
ncbi:unnamed protein product [Amoebophrya sp. A25]|nr:unnamed protein product [Amoebophrya sp. A25]|eukprot:GSA25T00025849001.1